MLLDPEGGSEPNGDVAMTKPIKMRNLHRDIDWKGVSVCGSRLLLYAMDERSFDPDYKLGAVKDDYIESLYFEVIGVGPKVEDLKVGDIVAVANPALDFLGHDRYFSCEQEDVVFYTQRNKQPPLTEEELTEGWAK